ncbi:MAG: EAL domain-containing protein [Acidimicrobiia bacterium]|nr:EAL domain-containing protein [Acidimicrobiia bacterium]MDH5236181.1 EAL domain-containing protein [Acidimicrobiia bacterium]
MESLEHIIAHEGDQGLVAVLVVRPDVTGTLKDTDDADFISWAGEFEQRLSHVDGRLRLAFRSAEEAIGFVPGLSSRREIAPLVERLAAALDAPMVLGSAEISVDSRAGIAVVDATNPGLTEALEAADLAITQTQPDHKARSFRPFRRLQRDRWDALEARIRADLESGDVMVRYQPIVELGSGAVQGVEALARLRDGRHGELSPGVFLPVAARHGLMSSVGAGVLTRVGEDVKRWRDQVDAPLAVWINLSVREVLDPQAMSSVDQLTDPHPLVSVGVELTDTALASADDVGRARFELADRKLLAAVDYHAVPLTEVARRGFDAVKLDRRVIRHLDARSGEATRSLVAMLHALDVTVTAEGIETEAHLRPAIAANCDHGQGFYFARPTDSETIDRLLGTRQRSETRPTEPATVARDADPPGVTG